MGLYGKIIDLQKLHAAWDRVKRNKPAAGADHVTYEQYEANKKQELKQLNLELVEHRYETIPVKLTTIYKGEKAREIALYSMRDKVVQQSIASELTRIFDPLFSSQTYAYRPNKAALSAVEVVDEELKKGETRYFLKVDIRHFFDEIDWWMLKRILEKHIHEEDVIELIRANVLARRIDEYGELLEKQQGIYQGSAIAPVLSNIYMMTFDRWLQEQNVFYIRYSDDILILGNDKTILLSLLTQIKENLRKMKLHINENKSYITTVEEGVDYLGYHFSSEGKSIPKKAEQSLEERLEFMWLTNVDLTTDEKIKKAAEIIGGWEQYFQDKRSCKNIFQYVTLLALSRNKLAYVHYLEKQRKSLSNDYYDIMVYLANQWRQLEAEDLELYEYEQYFGIEKLDLKNSQSVSDSSEQEEKTSDNQLKYRDTLIVCYRKLIIRTDKDNMLELMQCYTDMGAYEKAAFWMGKAEEDNYNRNSSSSEQPLVHMGTDEKTPFEERIRSQVSVQLVRKFMKFFVGREDIYSKETMGYGQKRQSEIQTLPLTEQLVQEHMLGHQTLGTAIQRANSTVHFLVLDVDISKKVLLQYDRNSEQGIAYLQKTLEYAKALLHILKMLGLTGYMEYSGCRGYHIWILFREWVPVRYVNLLEEVIQKKANELEPSMCDGITLEYFPNKTRIKPGKYGQVMKLPYGNHVRTNEMSYFIEDDASPVVDLTAFLDTLATASLTDIKKILSVNSGIKEISQRKELELDMESLGDISDNIRQVLDKCSLMKYLCNKVISTGYLSHFERMSVLYVFGHLGDEGHQFVHSLMSHTLNYQYHTTQKFINKIPEKPISCVKLRDQYKQITAEYGCNCVFKRTKNCYPSPVLHAISTSKDAETDITLPTSRTVSKEKQKEVLEEINIHKKAQELAGKIVDLKKQKRRLDSNISKVEKELGTIYDNASVDCLEIEMGMLVRRKTEKGVEWLIEL